MRSSSLLPASSFPVGALPESVLEEFPDGVVAEIASVLLHCELSTAFAMSSLFS
jgi:hypothetical protein